MILLSPDFNRVFKMNSSPSNGFWFNLMATMPALPVNTFEDMINGHYLNGAARGLRAMFLSFGIVFGATLAMLAEKSIAWMF